MEVTSLSLLERLRGDGSDATAWVRFDSLYRPLIGNWLRRHATPGADADDLAQEVMSVLLRELPQFEHNGRPGAFRTWLRGITANRLRTYWRGRKGRPIATGDLEFLDTVNQLEDSTSELSRRWDREHDEHVVTRLLDLMEQEFEPATLCAFRLLTFDGLGAEAVAAQLDMTVGAVYVAKSRVLSRLRQEAREFLD